MKKSCAFFGHRELFCDISEQLDIAIHTAINTYDISSFWCGNYGAFDLASAHAVKRIQAQYPWIESLWIRAYMPTPHETVHALYHDSIYPEGLELVPKRFAISKRNEWITTHCDMVIAYVNSRYGGAYAACHRFARSGRPIINLGTLTHI